MKKENLFGYVPVIATPFNKKGEIKFIWPKVKVNGHAEDVLKKVKELN